MLVALDTETALATNDEPIPELVSVALNPGGLFVAHDPNLLAVLEWVFSPENTVAMANAPFDIHVLLRAFPSLLPLIIRAYFEDRIFDVLTREKMIDIAEGTKRGRKYNLGAVAMRRCDLEVNKNDPWRLRYAELLGLELADWPAEAVQYATHDAYATHAVAVAQEAFRVAHSIDVFADAGRQARGHLALYAQTLRGIRTDPDAVAALDRRLITEITEHTLHCLDHGLARVQGKKKPKIVRDTKAARAMLEAWPGRDRSKLTDAGDIALSESALKAANLPPGHPLDHYRRKGAAEATRTKNVLPLQRPIIRTRYDELKETGRTGSSAPQGNRKVHTLEPWEWVGTNLQNLPKKGGFRSCLVPPPGHVFVVSDWEGAELVTFAQVQIDLFGRSTLADVLRSGKNPHTELGAKLAGVPSELFDPKGNPEHKEMRQLAKPLNFGYPGGLGAARFVDFASKEPYNFKLTEDEAKQLKEEWLEQWPEAKLYFDYISNMQGPDGLITLMQPRSGRIRGGCSFTEACNSTFQGLAADAAKLALWWLWLAGLDSSSPLYGGGELVGLTGQCLFVHDENVTVVRREVAEAARAEQDRIMIAAFAHFCPDVPIKVDSQIVERYPEK